MARTGMGAKDEVEGQEVPAFAQTVERKLHISREFPVIQ